MKLGERFIWKGKVYEVEEAYPNDHPCDRCAFNVRHFCIAAGTPVLENRSCYRYGLMARIVHSTGSVLHPTTICTWCNGILKWGTREGLSHGICRRCLERKREELKKEMER